MINRDKVEWCEWYVLEPKGIMRVTTWRANTGDTTVIRMPASEAPVVIIPIEREDADGESKD